MSAIETRSLSAAYASGGHMLPVLEDIDLDVDDGEFYCLLGPSGCGKSTLLSILAGLQKPSSGVVRVNGKNITGTGLDRAVVFQSSTVFPWMTARQNLEFALEASGRNRRSRSKLAGQFLEIVGLEFYEGFFPGQLSGGMQQRLALARAFALGSPLLLLDEPFGAADALTRMFLQDLLLDLRSHFNTTVLMVTHDVDEALLLADRVGVMSPRPGHLIRVVKVSFPHPRHRDQLCVSSQYQSLRFSLLHGLQAELLEVFAAQKSKVSSLWDTMSREPAEGPDYEI